MYGPTFHEVNKLACPSARFNLPASLSLLRLHAMESRRWVGLARLPQRLISLPKRHIHNREFGFIKTVDDRFHVAHKARIPREINCETVGKRDNKADCVPDIGSEPVVI